MNEVRKVIGVVGGKLWSSPVYSLAVDWDAQARPAGSELKNTVRRWVVFVLVGNARKKIKGIATSNKGLTTGSKELLF